MTLFKAYCHTAGTLENEEPPIECHEISFMASPSALREVAAFLLECADKFEQNKAEGMDHFHLRDKWQQWLEHYPDVIAVSPDIGT